ncbi:MAG TPA: BTAD domain-containing putative transcriptional regulator [Gaiellaceae bacterium]|nr:BTAD domain-containing putative transcriptional regulator [Gaiellaceae bacterium]
MCSLGSRKQRALLAILLLNAREVVSSDRLIEELWGGQAPATALGTLRAHVSRLRRALGTEERVRYRAGGYVLEIGPEELDVERFERLLEEGRRALARGDPSAREPLREALSLWRGPPLADVAYEGFAQAEIARLEELRLTALEERIEADLLASDHGGLVGELEALVRAHPLRERLRRLLMLALYRSGRQAEALDAYQAARVTLVEELGIEPSRELRELHQAILNQDPALDTRQPQRTRELPAGTVTFLFTDIEDSTRLLHELGDRYAEALAEHRRLLRQAFGRHGGVEVDTQGDAFFVAFASVKGAAAAATEAQEALKAGPIRVRMGLHTGEAVVSDEGYVGIDVHRAARIAAAGHGGQVLVSQTTHDLLGSEVELHEVRQHRLKDLVEPQRLYQLGDGDFPSLKSLNQSNLPVQPTPFVGREAELAQVLELVRARRLVTLTGPGGSGKTRLALQAAAELVDEFRDGVWFVGLASLRDPQLVLPTIAQTLGVREPQTAEDYLGDKEALLVLDNLERLLDAVPQLAELLRSAAALTLLVTSRASLRVSGEQEFPVPPLTDEEAVALFADRARAVKPTAALGDNVLDICRRLDNLPLAIELAAARMKLLSPEALLPRLEHRLPLLTAGTRDAPERQRTLRSTIEWSYELLGSRERELFVSFAVFAGGCELEAAERVCSADLETLGSLVDNSLIREREGRFLMLATIREYVAERLEARRDAANLHRLHAEHYLALAEAAEPEILGGGQVEWLARLERERDNFRSALAWALEHRVGHIALRLIGALRRAWVARGYLAETRRWLERALAADGAAGPSVRAKALYGYGRVALVQGDYEHAVPALEESAAFFREIGEARGLAFALADLGWIAAAQGAYDRARSFGEESLAVARDAGDETTIAAALHALGCTMLAGSDYAKARPLFEESLALRRRLGDKRNAANSLAHLGITALLEGEPTQAQASLAEALELATNLDNQLLVASALVNLGLVALFDGDCRRARSLACDSLAIAQRLGDKPTIVESLHVLAGAASADGRPLRAATLGGAAEALHDAIGAPPSPAERAVSERFESELRHHENDELATARAEGKAMTFDAVLDYALEQVDVERASSGID